MNLKYYIKKLIVWVGGQWEGFLKIKRNNINKTHFAFGWPGLEGASTWSTTWIYPFTALSITWKEYKEVHCLERPRLIREIGQQESCERQHGQTTNPVYEKEYALGSSSAEKDLGVLIFNNVNVLPGILLVWIRLTASWGVLTGGITDSRLEGSDYLPH